ncbi:Palmitoyltransferase pfa3 [Exophiala dermatitidis]
MPSYSTPSPSPPPTTSSGRRVRSCARKCERACCTVATYFPLAFVYGLSTWAVWVVGSIGFGSQRTSHTWWLVQGICGLGIIFYALANLSYTVAVFTNPGSPLQGQDSSKSKRRKGNYSVLPTTESSEPPGLAPADVQTITVSSTGAARYCKKCHTPKPDRTHHCSTCGRCVLKMDHHCPWLSTCLGLHNYKAFVLFLIYISLFAWASFASSAWWMWKEMFEESGYLDDLAPVNIILLAVISGIIGLVLTGFTGWHIYLCMKGQTTIEKLEKTRYLSGVRSRVERNRQDQQLHNHRRRSSEGGGVAERLQRAGQQILEFHANAVPGASRFEEGEEHTSPVPSVYNSTRDAPSSHQQPFNNYADGSRQHQNQQPQQYHAQHHGTNNNNDTPALRALRRTYSNIEAERERNRYAEYLDDRESEKLPNAFDLGWRRNLRHVFGPNPVLWFLPVCNTTGDGWRWEVSEKWLIAHEEASRRKEQRLAAAAAAMMEHDDNHRHHHGGAEYYYSDDVRMRGGGYETDRDYHGVGASRVPNHQQQPYAGNWNPSRDQGGGVYSQSAMSMKPLQNHGYTGGGTRGPGRGRRRQRRDFDRGDTFQVSTSGSRSRSRSRSSSSGDSSGESDR